MIRIYWAKQPAVLTDNVLPLLLSDGELTKDDIDSVFKRAGIGSYSDSHIDLGLCIRLFEKGDDMFILSPRARDGIRMKKGVRLFDFLRRIPHFSRWLELTYVEQRDVTPYDVLIEEERESEMRLNRPNLFETWDSQIRDRLETETIDELLTNTDYQPVYVWDKYLYYQSDNVLPLRSAILCTIGAAAKQGAAVTAEDMGALYDVETDDIEAIIQNVLEPIGCPLTTVNGAYTLDKDLRFTISNPKKAVETLQASIEERIEFTETDAAADLATAIEHQSHRFTYPGTEPVDFEIEVVPETERQSLYQFDDGVSDSSVLQTLQAQTQQKRRVTVPAGLTERGKSLLTAFRETLEAVESGETRGVDDQLQRHLRSRYEYLGAVPMLTPPSYETLTELGHKFLDTPPSERRQFLQSVEFVCNPLIQSTLALVDLVDITQRSNQWMASITGSNVPFGQLLTEVLAHQGYEVVTDQNQNQRDATIIAFAMQLRMVEVDSRTHNLSLQNQFGKDLRSGELGIFSFYNEIEQEVRTALPKVIEA